MPLRTIRKQDDAVLRKKSVKVKKFTPQLAELLDDMKETMLSAEGIGLAAPQVGISKRIIVVSNEDDIWEVINPEIVGKEGRISDIEGCLSLPGVLGEVERAEAIHLKGVNREGISIEMEVSGMLARVFQHEIDHLEGILFIDKANKILTPEEVKKFADKA